MPYNELVSVSENILSQLRPLDVQNYARATGWQRVQGVKGDIAVYHRADLEDDEIIVPQNPNYADYALRMAEAVSALSEAEHRLPGEIVADLLLPPADVLRFREEGPTTQDGGIGLQDGIRLLSSVRKTLLATACDIVQPQRFHPRLSFAEAVQFVDSCRLGQTERGSFTATFICPLDVVPGVNTLSTDPFALFPELPSEPFTRRVTKTLMGALEQVSRFINADQAERLVSPQEGDIVVSSNFYQALAEMQPSDTRAGLRVASTWSRAITPPAMALPTSVHLRSEYFPLVAQVAETLRPDYKPRTGLFVGRVEALNGETNAEGRMQGEIEIEFLQDEEAIRARIELSAEDYAQACDAHKNSEIVLVSGTLHRGRRLNAIRNHHDFRVLHNYK